MSKIMKKYLFRIYAVFWCAILLIGACMLLIKSQVLTTILTVVSSWIPVIIFSLMFHQIYPGEKLTGYLKRQFRERVHFSTILCILAIMCLIVAASLIITGAYTGKPVLQLLVTSPGALVSSFFYNLINGPIGEEVGWRGYMLNELQEKYSPLKSTCIVTFFWAFWHMPLWFTSGYTGIKLIQYIICFLVYMFAGSIIITAFYNINHNLIIPILLHQLYNFLNTVQTNNILQIITLYAVLYSVAAIVLILVNYRKCLRRKMESY